MTRNTLFFFAMALLAACQAGIRPACADPTRCPDGMANIQGEYCIDVYEYPNVKGEHAAHGVTRAQAEDLCRRKGKRLCARREWREACAGPVKQKYPYGDDYQKGFCSDPYSPAGQGHYPSGDLQQCVNGYGVYDMSGNLAEWTADTYDDGKYGVAAGGDAYSDDPGALACGGAFRRDAADADPYLGFRCCADVLKAPVSRSSIEGMTIRGAASPLVSYPLSSYENHFTASLEYVDVENIVGATPMVSHVSASGINLSIGYQFDGGRFDYTRAEYDLDAAVGGVEESSDAGLNVFHVSLLLPLNIDLWDWTGDMSIGMRRLESSAGQITETYLVKEFIQGMWTVIPSVNYLDNSRKGSDMGTGVDIRYRLNSRMNLLGKYSTNDFYKNLLNDFIVPYSSVAGLMECVGCRVDSGSAGIDYSLPKSKGKIYLMYYDIGDLDVPMGGAVIDF